MLMAPGIEPNQALLDCDFSKAEQNINGKWEHLTFLYILNHPEVCSTKQTLIFVKFQNIFRKVWLTVPYFLILGLLVLGLGQRHGLG